ncbi:MAG: membrane dipeptidase [Lachnospiraceae bacterium]|nr:membrane dipeptidase [Lachnospiraceae bacterium]
MKIIDMHCDTISRIYREREQDKEANLRENMFQADLMKMKSADYLMQNFALFIDLSETQNPYETFHGQLAVFREEIQKNSDLILPVTDFTDILANEKQGKMSALLTLEEGEVCGGSPDRLSEIYDLGVRMMTFTWNYPNTLGFPAEPAPLTGLKNDRVPRPAALPHPNPDNGSVSLRPQKGLTSMGIEFLSEMERLGIIADVSHLSDEGIQDVCRFATRPFCASHSNAQSLCGRGRNLTDTLIQNIAEKGGVIGVNYYGPFLSDTPDEKGIFFSRAKDIVRHICHISNIGGIYCIGLGSDFDGIDDNLELENCSQMELLEHELRKCGFHTSEIEQIFYKNVLNFYRELL